jgi:hypothetical protein
MRNTSYIITEKCCWTGEFNLRQSLASKEENPKIPAAGFSWALLTYQITGSCIPED